MTWLSRFLTTFFQLLTLWRLSEAVSVSFSFWIICILFLSFSVWKSIEIRWNTPPSPTQAFNLFNWKEISRPFDWKRKIWRNWSTLSKNFQKWKKTLGRRNYKAYFIAQGWCHFNFCTYGSWEESAQIGTSYIWSYFDILA